MVNLEYANGGTASFTMTAFNPGGARKTRIGGTRGYLETDNSAVIRHFDYLTSAWKTIDTATADRDAHAGTTVLLNWSNPLVRRIADLDDEVLFARSVRLLHLQAVLATGRPLAASESEALTSTLTDLMILGLGRTDA